MRVEPRKIKLEMGESEIDVEVSQLKTSQQLIFILFVGKIVGGSAGTFISKMDGSGLANLMEQNEGKLMDKVGESLATLIERLEEKAVLEKLDLLISSASHNGEKLYVDHPVFQGNLPQLFKVAKIAIEVNYKNFLPAISALFKKGAEMKKKMQELKDSQKVQP